MFKDEKIDYTRYLVDKPLETDPAKLSRMRDALREALVSRGVHGHISVKYYTDGKILVHVNYIYYGVFDSTTGEFFSGAPGD